eukprot:403369401
MTSVSGHLMRMKFPIENKIWIDSKIKDLYRMPVVKDLIDGNARVLQNLHEMSQDVEELHLWLDCDREGEAIAFDVADMCKQVNKYMLVKRAHFSALTSQDVNKAAQNLQEPNKNLADAVKARQEIDLRIGASFTQLQTLSFKDVLFKNSTSGNKILSYGPCQFPTLGFVVERANKIKNFKSEITWRLELVHSYNTKEEGSENTTKQVIKFISTREKELDKKIIEDLYSKIKGMNPAVIDVTKTEKYRPRPTPLNTIEAQKLISKKLGFSSDHAMEYMEDLYRKAYISYPRTETNVYHPTINLRRIIQELNNDKDYSGFTKKLLELNNYGGPRNGKQDDKAHPPIHPVRFMKEEDKVNLPPNQVKVYDMICRHFLASVSKDAVAQETVVKIQIGEEQLQTQGLIVEKKNYLEIFPFDTWDSTLLPDFKVGEQITYDSLKVAKTTTKPPQYLSESDLIDTMDQNGIGTDATIHEHIKKIQERQYAMVQGKKFKPTLLGQSLIDAYEEIGVDIHKPYLRAQMEREMRLIAEGKKSKDEFLKETLTQMEGVYDQVSGKVDQIKNYLQVNYKQQFDDMYTLDEKEGVFRFSGDLGDSQNLNFNQEKKQQEIVKQVLGENSQERGNKNSIANTKICKCYKCNKNDMVMMISGKTGNPFFGCQGFPKCINPLPVPRSILKAEVSNESCPSCFALGRDIKKVKFFYDKEKLTQVMKDTLLTEDPKTGQYHGTFCVYRSKESYCDINYELLFRSSTKIKQHVKKIAKEQEESEKKLMLQEQKKQLKTQKSEQKVKTVKESNAPKTVKGMENIKKLEKKKAKRALQKQQAKLENDKSIIINKKESKDKLRELIESQLEKDQQTQPQSEKIVKPTERQGCGVCGKKRHSKDDQCEAFLKKKLMKE